MRADGGEDRDGDEDKCAMYAQPVQERRDVEVTRAWPDQPQGAWRGY